MTDKAFLCTKDVNTWIKFVINTGSNHDITEAFKGQHIQDIKNLFLQAFRAGCNHIMYGPSYTWSFCSNITQDIMMLFLDY